MRAGLQKTPCDTSKWWYGWIEVSGKFRILARLGFITKGVAHSFKAQVLTTPVKQSRLPELEWAGTGWVEQCSGVWQQKAAKVEEINRRLDVSVFLWMEHLSVSSLWLNYCLCECSTRPWTGCRHPPWYMHVCVCAWGCQWALSSLFVFRCLSPSPTHTVCSWSSLCKLLPHSNCGPRNLAGIYRLHSL